MKYFPLQRILSILIIPGLIGLFTVTSASAAPAIGQAQSGSSPQKGWQLQQRHGTLRGLDVYVSSQAIKINGRNYNWGVISKAPDWDAICYSRSSKVICHVPYARWSEPEFAFMNSTFELDSPPRDCPARPTVFKGLAVVVKRWRGPAPKLGLLSQPSNAGLCDYMLIGATGIPAPAQAKLLMRRFYETPEIAGLPIKFSGSTELENALLETVAFRQTLMGPEVFTPPTGFKRVGTAESVFVSAKDKGMINDASVMLGRP